jgi:hypothetical protein
MSPVRPKPISAKVPGSGTVANSSSGLHPTFELLLAFGLQSKGLSANTDVDTAIKNTATILFIVNTPKA